MRFPPGLRTRLLVTTILGLAACTNGKTSPDAGPAEAGAPHATGVASVELASRDGAALYASLCSVCHGDDATGYKADHAPALVSATFLESASDEQLRRSIVDGRPGTSMAPYGKERGGPLGAVEVDHLVRWIRGHGPAARPLPPRPPGDAARGAPLYAERCQRCHGDAKTRGDAVHLGNAKFLEVASNEFIGWAIRFGRPGTTMEPWLNRLSDEQIDDIVAHVRSFDSAARPELLAAPTDKDPIVLNPTGKTPSFTPRSTPCPPSAKCEPDQRFVSIDQVKRALDAKQRMAIIDARPPSDWMRVHIPGAVSIPYHDLKRLPEVPNDGTWVIAYCACPHHLSGDVVDALRRRGIKRAVILDEGILEWHRRGYPVVTAPGVEPPPKLAPAASR